MEESPLLHRLHRCMALVVMLLVFEAPALADSIEWSETTQAHENARRDLLLKERQSGTTPSDVTAQALEGLRQTGTAALETSVTREAVGAPCQGASCPPGSATVPSGLYEKVVSPPANQDPTTSLGTGGENR